MERLDHPVIDADGHVIEFMPAVLPYIREELGPDLFERYTKGRKPMELSIGGESSLEWRLRHRIPQSAWWANPAANTRDLATAAIPKMLYERLPEMGIDYAVLFPTRALGTGRIDDDDLRIGICRGFNRYFADHYGPYTDRMAAAGIVTMQTPDEALSHIAHCEELGIKAVGFPEGVWRPIPEPLDGASIWLAPGQTHWWDTYGLDSIHDYDPVWQRLSELGMPFVSHGGLGHAAPSPYTSITSYSANHIGAFAQKMYPLCRSMFMGGVTKRFQGLSLGFLECGVGWACTMLNDIVEHWEKRRPDALDILDPDRIDLDALAGYLQQYGPELLGEVSDVREAAAGVHVGGTMPEEIDEWIHLGSIDEDELISLFADRMYFGCEADDRSTAFAFSGANAGGVRLRPVFSSDISHWDVPDMAAVVEESYELVTDGLITEQDYREFVFENPARLYSEHNPSFFSGTAVESALATVS